MTYIAGVGIARGRLQDEESLNELVFEAAAGALADAGLTRSDIDGISLAASDQLDARAISSMVLVGPAGGYLRDEVKVSDDGSLALATAVLRIEAGASRRVLAVSWTKSSESPWAAALGVNSDPILTRPVALHPFAAEAMVAGRFLDRHGIDPDALDRLAAKLRGVQDAGSEGADVCCYPLTHAHVPPPTDGAVALVVTREPADVEVSGLAWGVQSPEPANRERDYEDALRAVAGQACAQASVACESAPALETTDRTAYHLCLAVSGLGLRSGADAADALLAGGLAGVNPTGGLWSSNPPFAAGLECVSRAVQRVREGAPYVLAHSSYGFGSQGHLVAVLQQP